MKKFFVLLLAVVFVAAVALIGCKKKEAPRPTQQPTVTPVAPPPPPAPAPVPAPKHAKPAKK